MKLLLSLITITAAAVAVGCGSGGDDADRESAGAAGAAVAIKTFMFEPDPIEVEPGTTITWTNQDQTAHTVTSGPRKKPDGRFDAKLAEGATHSETFDEPGTHRYFCALHSGPGMEATVIVR